MSNTKNTHKSNQYECLGKDAESPLGLHNLWSSLGSIPGVADTHILAMATVTFPEVILTYLLQNKIFST